MLRKKYLIIGSVVLLSFGGGSLILGDTLQRQNTEAQESLLTPTVDSTPTLAPTLVPTIIIWPTYTPTPIQPTPPQWHPDTEVKKAVEDYMSSHPTEAPTPIPPMPTPT